MNQSVDIVKVKERQAARQTDRQIYRQTDRQTDGQRDRQTDRRMTLQTRRSVPALETPPLRLWLAFRTVA